MQKIQFLGFELDTDYYKIAEERINDTVRKPDLKGWWS